MRDTCLIGRLSDKGVAIMRQDAERVAKDRLRQKEQQRGLALQPDIFVRAILKERLELTSSVRCVHLLVNIFLVRRVESDTNIPNLDDIRLRSLMESGKSLRSSGFLLAVTSSSRCTSKTKRCCGATRPPFPSYPERTPTAPSNCSSRRTSRTRRRRPPVAQSPIIWTAYRSVSSPRRSLRSVSQHIVYRIEQPRIGEEIDVRGPIGEITYNPGDRTFEIGGKKRQFDKVCGGVRGYAVSGSSRHM